MARMEYAKGFVDDVSQIWSPSAEAHLRRVLSMLEAFPLSGSSNVPESIAREFDDTVRKCSVRPFDLIYEYDEDADVVFVHGLIHQKRAW